MTETIELGPAPENVLQGKLKFVEDEEQTKPDLHMLQGPDPVSIMSNPTDGFLAEVNRLDGKYGGWFQNDFNQMMNEWNTPWPPGDSTSENNNGES